MRNFDATASDWCFPEGYSLVGLAHWNKFHASVLVSATLMRAVGGYDPGVPWGLEDWNFWLHAALHNPRVRFVPEATFWYRQHAGSSMRKAMFAAHLEETKACVRTNHAGLFEPAQLLRDHETIAAMARTPFRSVPKPVAAKAPAGLPAHAASSPKPLGRPRAVSGDGAAPDGQGSCLSCRRHVALLAGAARRAPAQGAAPPLGAPSHAPEALRRDRLGRCQMWHQGRCPYE